MDQFSSFEAKKEKRTAKVCRDCSKSNPYFDRRHAVCAAFSGRYAAPPWHLPSFSREILSCVFSFAKESRFVTIGVTSFSCSLCNKTFSFLANGGDGAPVERHLRTSQQHAKRFRGLELGTLVEISQVTGGDLAARLRHGLGLRDQAFCSLDQVKEAANLVDVWALRVQEPELDPDLFRALKCREEDPDSRGPRWASAEQLAKARQQAQLRQERVNLAAPGHPELAAFFASAGMEDVARATQRAQVEKVNKLRMLCSTSGGEDSDDQDMQALFEFLAS